MEPTEVRTLAAHVRVESPKVRGSRFIGDAAPAVDEAEALAVLDAVRAREPSATHHCWAYALQGGRERSSDDGEPSGTAGPPILRRIGGAGLSDVVVVVTRHYGGTKLGTGGLVRAYGGCAAEVLASGEVVVRPVVARFRLTHPYDLTGPVEAVLAGSGAVVADARFTDEVALEVTMPITAADGFIPQMTEATAGAVVPRRL